MDREIKVTKFNDQGACEFDDRISIEFMPIELFELKGIFEARALETKDFSKQGYEREMHDVFAAAREMWEKARREKDK